MSVKVPYGFRHAAFTSKHRKVIAIINCSERKGLWKRRMLSVGENGLQKGVGRNTKITGYYKIQPHKNPRKSVFKV